MKKLIDTYFTTATILNWYPLLENDKFKDIIIDSFRFAVENKRINIFAFVIMKNHFHVVWQILPPYNLGQVRQNMLKYTAQQFKYILMGVNKNYHDNKRKNHSNDNGTQNYKHENMNMLSNFKVDKIDRAYQFWKRDPLSVKITNEKVLIQKINYIHSNRYKKGGNDLTYKYSSAYYYETGDKKWDFLL